MKYFIRDFEAKLDEIEEYFQFMQFIDQIETHKKRKIIVESKEYIPKREIQKILRSNTFLLLYNLVESSVRNGILAVYDCIHDESLKYEDLSDRIKNIWLMNKTKNLQASTMRIQSWLRVLITEFAESSVVKLGKDSINISGNLDYDNVQKIVNSYGFFGKITLDSKDVRYALNKIKTERNLLAHGNKSFCHSGEIITINELNRIKNIATQYMRELLLNIEIHIDEKKYRH